MDADFAIRQQGLKFHLMHSGDFAGGAERDEFFLEEGDRHFTHPVGSVEAMFLNELVGDVQGDLHLGLWLGV